MVKDLGEKFFMVSDGKRVLHLYPVEEGGYCVTCPFDPAIITQAETVEEAFDMAEDAANLLAEARSEKYGRTRNSSPAKKLARKRSVKKLVRS